MKKRKLADYEVASDPQISLIRRHLFLVRKGASKTTWLQATKFLLTPESLWL